MKAPALFLLVAVLSFAQAPAPSPAGAVPTSTDPEQQQLIQALSESSSSPIDMVRVLEAHLKQFPNSPQRKEIERVLAKAAIDVKDDRRTVLYGEAVLVVLPDDAYVLDRVTRALLALGGKANAEKALKYAHSFEENVRKLPALTGRDIAKKQEDRERGLGRMYLYDARAQTILGHPELAVKLAAQSYATFADRESAEEWGKALIAVGEEKAAIARYADAFTIADARTTDADRAALRQRLGEIYRKVNGSESGLGNEILAAYDRTTALVDGRTARLRELDPNMGVTDAMQFTVTGIDGKKLQFASLRGKVLVLDFWATWCVPCRAQHPLYEQVKQRFKDRSDVLFLAIDTDEQRDLVAPFIAEQKWDRNVYFEDGLSRLLQISSIPSTLLYDKEGRLASRMDGFMPERFVEQLTERIQFALTDPTLPGR